MTEPPPHGGRVLYGGLRGVGWTPLAHALRCCTQRPNRGPAGRRPPGIWGRGAGRRAWGRGCGWHRVWDKSPASRLGSHAQRPLATPSIRRGHAAQGYGLHREQGHGASFRAGRRCGHIAALAIVHWQAGRAAHGLDDACTDPALQGCNARLPAMPVLRRSEAPLRTLTCVLQESPREMRRQRIGIARGDPAGRPLTHEPSRTNAGTATGCADAASFMRWSLATPTTSIVAPRGTRKRTSLTTAGRQPSSSRRGGRNCRRCASTAGVPGTPVTSSPPRGAEACFRTAASGLGSGRWCDRARRLAVTSHSRVQQSR